jgi:hypothetical protein
MKFTDSLPQIEATGISNEMDFSISKEGMPWILDILRNRLYSNKTLAIIRELSCNAADAMVAVGKGNEPIRITLPNELSPQLKIRDFGPSLSPDELRRVFVQYGASTKRDSNAYIGQLGIGAKSPFCYCDSFMVATYQAGTVRTYSCFIDPSRCGKMVQLGEDAPTDEPDGLEVIVCVKEGDINTFISEAKEFFRYWKVKPTFEGQEVTFPEDAPLYSAADGSWIIPTERGETSVLIMGNIPYPLESHNLKWEGQDISLKKLFSLGIRMYVGIGDIDFAASREALEYTEKTQATIFKALAAAREGMLQVFKQKITSASSMLEAKRLYASFFLKDGSMFEMQSLVDKVTFQGKEITSSYWDIGSEKDSGMSIKRYETNYKGRLSPGSDAFRINCENTNGDIALILNDSKVEQGLKNRLLPLLTMYSNVLKKRCTSVLVFTIKDQALWDKWVADNMFEWPFETTKMSALPALKMKEIFGDTSSSYRSYSGAYNPKYSAKVFRFEYNDTRSGHRRREKASDYWQKESFDLANDEGVYLEIFEYEGSVSNSWLTATQELCQDLGISFPSPLIGIKAGTVLPEDNNLISFNNYMKETLNTVVAQGVIPQQIANFNEGRKHTDFVDTLADRADKLVFDKDCPLGKLIAHYREVSPTRTTDKNFDLFLKLCERFGITVTLPTVNLKYDFKAETEAVCSTYPILKNFPWGSWDIRTELEEWYAALNHYIALIEAGIKKNINTPVVAQPAPVAQVEEIQVAAPLTVEELTAVEDTVGEEPPPIYQDAPSGGLEAVTA